MAAKLSERERSATTEIQRDIQSITHREIGPASAGRLANAQRLPRFDIDRYPEQYRLAIQRRVGRGTGQGDDRVAMKPQRRSEHRRFDARSMRLITDDPVSQPERPVVHRPRWRYPDIPVPDAAGIVLDRGISTRVQHLDSARTIRERVKKTR